MQWGQIKTLFILCFLILDVFLVFQFMNKTEQAQLGLLTDTSLEEQLKTEDIQLNNVPKEAPKKSYISAKRYAFKEEDKEELEENENQKPEIYGEDNNILISVFEEPVAVDLESSDETIEGTINNKILFGDEYQFWDYNEKYNVLIFFQRFKEDPIYYNESGIVMAQLNEEKDGITAFVQTHLDDLKSTEEKIDLVKPIQAIGNLFDKNKLYSGDVVSKFDVGYYTLVPLENGDRVFSPTWNIKVNEDQNFIISGLEGQYISTDEDEFVNETMSSISKQIDLEQSIWGGGS
ncbi:MULTISPECIES: two-component system regulatory protein YycI [Pontibacillus]|uniref:Two-component system regulatory protein YycI n=1 Tax=Pontibacillus chungwhensis TaxID=265426 RepID=A0ABY8UYN1_9BACI|nr:MULTISPECIES: two-component system regulatory protein YycI [Pontibacillus]MCD5325641.1 two-component system regulatory protein YycI [Pontibacillus sp. HN14]WIF98112.1 two-component system regulatory protein YycI [Pontibacillus chungwhensis]